MQAVRLKIRDSHLTCKIANKCLNVRERVLSLKENPGREKKRCYFACVFLCSCITSSFV